MLKVEKCNYYIIQTSYLAIGDFTDKKSCNVNLYIHAIYVTERQKCRYLIQNRLPKLNMCDIVTLISIQVINKIKIIWA